MFLKYILMITFGPHTHESPTPQLHMLNKIGLPVLFRASPMAVYLSTIQSLAGALQLSYLRKSTPRSAKYCASSSSLPLLPGRPRQVLLPASLYMPYLSPTVPNTSCLQCLIYGSVARAYGAFMGCSLSLPEQRSCHIKEPCCAESCAMLSANA